MRSNSLVIWSTKVAISDISSPFYDKFDNSSTVLEPYFIRGRKHTSKSNIFVYNKAMATPIKITPVIKGNDSVYFKKQLNKSAKKRVSPTEKKRIFSLVDKVLANSKSLSK